MSEVRQAHANDALKDATRKWWTGIMSDKDFHEFLQHHLSTDVPQGCTRLQVVTRHPQDYVLQNEQDGTKWRGTVQGGWVAEPKGR